MFRKRIHDRKTIPLRKTQISSRALASQKNPQVQKRYCISLSVDNCIKYLRSTFRYDTDSKRFELNDNEYESKLGQGDPLSDNLASDRSLKEICIKNLNRIEIL